MRCSQVESFKYLRVILISVLFDRSVVVGGFGQAKLFEDLTLFAVRLFRFSFLDEWENACSIIRVALDKQHVAIVLVLVCCRNFTVAITVWLHNSVFQLRRIYKRGSICLHGPELAIITQTRLALVLDQFMELAHLE